MKALRIQKNGRDVYKKQSELKDKMKIAIFSFLVGAMLMYIVLHCVM